MLRMAGKVCPTSSPIDSIQAFAKSRPLESTKVVNDSLKPAEETEYLEGSMDVSVVLKYSSISL
jgi:hypothetical protein